MFIKNLNELLVEQLNLNSLKITAMESCTGGLFLSTLTDVEGASSVTEGGYVTYSNKSKVDVGVSSSVIDIFGVYSRETAVEMAQVCKHLIGADIGVGITGTFTNLDINNSDSESCKVFAAVSFDYLVCVYDIFVPCASRSVQKAYVVNELLRLILQNILKTV